jgi:hypothetical protein
MAVKVTVAPQQPPFPNRLLRSTKFDYLNL